MTVTFQAASSAGMSCSNLGAVTFGAFSSVGSALYVLIAENATVGSTNVLLFGSLQTPATFGVGDSLVFAAGALTVVLT
jgi:hypothetical protein